jgi:hypothetical protein
MAGHEVDRRSGSALRGLVLVVDPAPEADLDEVDRSLRQLRAEFKDLDIESVVTVTSPSMPRGAKGVDSVSLGTLLITLTATGGVLPIVIETARDWLARHAAAQRISVTIDGDTIVLEKGSMQERSALIEAYVRRHEVR